MAAKQIPVWLDCDPGHDDVFAILLAAYHPSIRLLGISTVFGNASLKHTTWNATSVLTALSKEEDVSVYEGAAQALVRRPLREPAADIHGETGLDGTALLPQPLRRPADDVSAVEAMARALMVEPAGTAWLVATGTLTNVAAMFATHPTLVEHIAGLSIMGGAIGDGFTAAVAGTVNGRPRIGNTTPFAEFNILLDPEAAAALLHNPRLARKTTLIPLDLTHLVLATASVQDLLLHGPESVGKEASSSKAGGKTTLRTMLVELLNFFADTYKNVFGIVEGPPLHDPLAVAAVLIGTAAEIPFYDYTDDDRSRHERFDVRVVTDGTSEEALAGTTETGRTVARLLEPGAEGVRIPRGLDIPMFWRVIEECCTRADAANAEKGRS
ncbi:uridine nucleosidase [Grosmannia clavigera kw1407]|uniref:Uridine nucleosidase n=1 Tax=Grosmannia clavigera (strain kw1407 / UAMH 11150) TaxID=655863 RepID=F0XD22_GROCL|nr:uridine nucleosidase [Grosmannia clavigera kw1407]EFX04413.1 uridine nucleosidase [Grosmannia clavigera kw1407]